MNKNDFEKLAKVRLEEAKVLHDNRKFEGAYYLAGYAVECALKACIAKRTIAEEFPPKEKVVRKYYTHDLLGLLGAAELKGELDKKPPADPLRVSWATVARWNEESRYETHSEAEASELIDAIENKSHGVLPWLISSW